MDNSRNFYLSGLFSISLFALCFVLAITMLFSKKENNSYALKKDTFISISIVSPKTKSQASKAKQLKNMNSVPSLVKAKSVNINNLFSGVWTKKIVHKKTKKIVSNKVIHELQKKINMSETNNRESISKKIENINETSTKKEEKSSSTALEVNEYLAKIQAIVYQYFHVPNNSEGNSVKSVIELDALGRVLDFRVLQYSQNEALNNEADKIKDRIKNVIFPKNPQNIATRTIVILISKE